MKPARKKLASERLEKLEVRLHWSVSQDPNGWTVVTPSANENIIYVSNQGSDSNSGTSPSASVKSFAKAQSLMQNGKPNELLLEDGETFNDSFQNWSVSGADAQDPIVVGSYVGTAGSARPMVYTGTAGIAFGTGNYGTSGTLVSYLDVLGIQFDANLKDPTLGTVSTSVTGETKGFEFYATGTSILIEDCSFNYYGYDFDVESLPGNGKNLANSITNFEIRRSVVSNSYAFNGGRSQGMYAYDVSGLSIQQCDFDHDGWNATTGLGAEDIGYNHDLYIASTCSGVDIENSIFAESSYAGIMARAGGIINNNLFIDDTVAVSYGDADGADSTIGGVSGTLIGNTVVGDKAEFTTTASPLPFGQGFVIANTSPTGTVVVSGNLFTGDTQNAKPAIQLTMATGSNNASQEVGLNNVTLTGNVVNGWRYGIQLDGRFIPGGAPGEYALNNLKVSKNDFVDSSTQLVRHDGGFVNTTESWSADRYYDPASTLAQGKWVTLIGNNVPFATWASTYDIGATALSALPYIDPTRTVATYDTTLGGTGTFQDFLAQAKLLSISNYRTQYMANAAASYVEAGFNIVGGTGGSTNNAATTATSLTTNVNIAQLGLSSYTFTINFTGGSLLKAGSLGTGNLLVTGPNGYSYKATLVSEGTPTIDAAGYVHTAVNYKFVPAGGTWAIGKGQDGTYTIIMLGNQISDLNGNVMPDAVMGTFSVDLTPPTTVVTAPGVTSDANSYSFSITYSDANGIDSTSLYSGEVQVTGPNGFSQYAALNATTTNSTGTGIVANYTITPPGGHWTASNFSSGTYTIALGANLVYDLSGNPVTAGTLGSFAVQIGGSATGTASIAGLVFNDANGNGTFDSRELPMVGVQMFIDVDGTGIYNAADDPNVTTTDSNGAYTFSNLSAGRYTVVETVPPGYGVTASPGSGTGVITLTAGQVSTGDNFANQVGANTINSTPTTGTPSNNSGGTVTSPTTGPNNPPPVKTPVPLVPVTPVKKPLVPVPATPVKKTITPPIMLKKVTLK